MEFRPLRRTKRAISNEAAMNLLENERRGVLAVNGDGGYPFAFPINYIYDRKENKIFFHGAKSGHKVDALKKDDKVCFTVYGNEFRKEGEWAPYVQSVVVYGRCRLVDEALVTFSRVREIGMKYYPTEKDVDEEVTRDLPAVQIYEISIEHICGKQIQEK